MAVGLYPIAINPSTGQLGYDDDVTPSVFAPEDHNYLAWSFDPTVAVGGTIVPTGGLLHVVKLRADRAITVTNIVMHVVTSGATLTSGQNFAALYSGAGALLSSTATQHTAWQSGGVKVMALSAAQTVPAGYFYAAFYSVGSTLPTFSRGQNVGGAIGNAGLAAPSLRYAVADTGLTTAMPATIGTQTVCPVSYWVAVN